MALQKVLYQTTFGGNRLISFHHLSDVETYAHRMLLFGKQYTYTLTQSKKKPVYTSGQKNMQDQSTMAYERLALEPEMTLVARKKPSRATPPTRGSDAGWRVSGDSGSVVSGGRTQCPAWMEESLFAMLPCSATASGHRHHRGASPPRPSNRTKGSKVKRGHILRALSSSSSSSPTHITRGSASARSAQAYGVSSPPLPPPPQVKEVAAAAPPPPGIAEEEEDMATATTAPFLSPHRALWYVAPPSDMAHSAGINTNSASATILTNSTRVVAGDFTEGFVFHGHSQFSYGLQYHQPTPSSSPPPPSTTTPPHSSMVPHRSVFKAHRRQELGCVRCLSARHDFVHCPLQLLRKIYCD